MTENAKQRLTAEFMERQLWQFISLDEWLAAAHDNPKAPASSPLTTEQKMLLEAAGLGQGRKPSDERED